MLFIVQYTTSPAGNGANIIVKKRIEIWSPYRAGLSKSQLLKKGYAVLGNTIFNTWSCYKDGKVQCGNCESCYNRKAGFRKAGIVDKTRYLK